MGTEYLIIIILWCGDLGINPPFNDYRVEACRKRAIECVSRLKNFVTDDVINKCLLKTKGAPR